MLNQELDWISINGFKSIESTGRVQLEPVNIIIGPNGAGKSNFIDAFALLQTIKEGRLFEYVRTAGGADEILNFGAKVTQKLSIELSFMNEVNGYKLILKADNNDNLFPLSEEVSFGTKADINAHTPINSRQ